MDTRIKEYFENELNAILLKYNQFKVLMPSETNNGASHSGEDGRYVEYLFRDILKKYLPRNVEVLTGFILRAAVASGNTRKRKKDEFEISSQLDIIIFDTANYPVFQRFDDCVIVPPEGVIAIFSVKKHLRENDIAKEAEKLQKASHMCVHSMKNKSRARIPMTAIISMEDCFGHGQQKQLSAEEKGDICFKKLRSFCESEKCDMVYDDIVDFVGALSEWCIYKERIKNEEQRKTKFFFYDLSVCSKSFGFQIILQNVLSIYYNNSSDYLVRPGFTDVRECGYTKCCGEIEYKQRKRTY